MKLQQNPSSVFTKSTDYIALVDGTGFLKKDKLQKCEVRNGKTGAIQSTIWNNVTQGTEIAVADAPDLTVPEVAPIDSGSYREVLGSELIALTDAAAGTLTVPAGANLAEVSVYDGDVWITVDGTLPVVATCTGHLQCASNIFELESAQELADLQAVVDAGITAKLFVTYFCETGDNA